MKKFLNTLALSLCLLFGSTWLFATDYPGGAGGDHTASSTTILTNKTIDGDDNTVQDLAVGVLKDGTDGELITWGADAAATVVAAGTAGQALGSNGAGAAPTFQGSVGEVIRKTAVTTVNNSTTLVNVVDLAFPIGATEKVLVIGYILYDSGTVPDVKVDWSLPANTTGNRMVTRLNTSGTIVLTGAVGVTENQIGGEGAGTTSVLFMNALLEGVDTAGTAQLQFAQNTANGSDTKILADSILLIFRF